jgi:protein-S-isoprenylcysteine O-methyltransferase Ste14
MESLKSLKLFSVVGYVLMILALVPMVYVHALFSSSAVVITVQILAALLMVWARVTFGSRSFHYAANPTVGGLVTSGPYKYIRHPIYAAVIFFALAGIAANWTLINSVLFLVICVGAGLRIFCEERLIVLEYPEYTEYAKRTKRVVPFLF